MSDMSWLSSAVTYVSDDCTKLTWIDHVLSSVDMDTLIADICILDDVIVSDHRPISFCLQYSVLHGPVCTVKSSNTTYIVAEWSSCDTNTLNYYAAYLDNLLHNFNIPYDALFDTSCDASHRVTIEKFYHDIISCISKAVADVIPCRK